MRLAAGPVGPAAPRASAESGASGPPVPAAAARRRPRPSPGAHALPGAAGPGLLAAAAARTTLLAAQRGGGLEHLPPLAAPQESLRTPLTHQPGQCIPDLQASRSWHRQEADSRLPLRHRLPAHRRRHLPVLPLVTPRYLPVAKDMHPHRIGPNIARLSFRATAGAFPPASLCLKGSFSAK